MIPEILALLGRNEIANTIPCSVLLCSHSHGTHRLPLALVWLNTRYFLVILINSQQVFSSSVLEESTDRLVAHLSDKPFEDVLSKSMDGSPPDYSSFVGSPGPAAAGREVSAWKGRILG